MRPGAALEPGGRVDVLHAGGPCLVVALVVLRAERLQHEPVGREADRGFEVSRDERHLLARRLARGVAAHAHVLVMRAVGGVRPAMIAAEPSPQSAVTSHVHPSCPHPMGPLLAGRHQRSPQFAEGQTRYLALGPGAAVWSNDRAGEDGNMRRTTLLMLIGSTALLAAAAVPVGRRRSRSVSGQVPTIVGTEGDDSGHVIPMLEGTAGDDVIVGWTATTGSTGTAATTASAATRVLFDQPRRGRRRRQRPHRRQRRTGHPHRLMVGGRGRAR